ncbi:hypothetical protein ASPWEDRAFT_28859 [Aspergillus wentii DTO 134E9]|uniref:Fe2OG dioxygenase domain-containing protein n=1 Tax=Aspergillus wentii DTO 134E9 TaxID=1073089 RepID=A0A1L9RFE8_ASPWE|nr:uncharacterized protein ASPWEDRAFT_28859 [Aspergillus wentii DTO 134E9]KAI9925414.1 hypothetical protein MW887_005795 [Aspergillus wentii]OJJ33645.1 hypothetical protein ASPWEDRAFT_28859 [Aspergillus wentii DTO 134E9]
MAKRTLDSFFKPQNENKKPKIEPTSSTHHPSYPSPISDLPSHISVGLCHATPDASPREINNQPHLDLLYMQPFIPSPTAKELFKFLRDELPFYRVQYSIRRGAVETIVNTPRFTTVFGVDDTSKFIQNEDSLILVDSKTDQPVRMSRYQYTPRPIPPCLDLLRQRVEAATADGTRYNFCLVNFYATGDDSIAYHSDDERFLASHPTIASLSLGARRDFVLKHKPAPDMDDTDSKDPLKFALGPGDMIIMRGETQANWLHSIPKRRGESQGRINITFRKAVVPAGTNNYYNYNVGSGPVYRWDEGAMKMVKRDHV